MNEPTGKSGLTLVSLTVLAIALLACQSPGGGDAAGELRAAAEAAGVKIRDGEIYTVSRGDESWVTAPIAGWENTPATELANGVDFGFAHISSSEAGVSEGFYTLRATADGSNVGSTEARVELIDRSGEVAGTIASVAEIHTTSLPDPLPFETSFVTSRPGDFGRTYIWYRCPNGVCIRVPIFVPRPIGFPIARVEDSARGALEQASREADVDIDAAQTFAVFRSDAAVATAPISAWADIAADQLPNGVDFGYAYISSETIPAGYYTLRVFAEPTGPGLVDARVAVTDSRGEVVSELPAEIEIHSMTIPDERRFPGSIITTFPGTEPFLFWYQCSNGQCVRIRLI